MRDLSICTSDVLLAQLLGTSEEDSVVDTIYDKMYENFVEEVDAVDNGISQWAEGEPRYAMTTTLSPGLLGLIPPGTSPTKTLRQGSGEQWTWYKRSFCKD